MEAKAEAEVEAEVETLAVRMEMAPWEVARGVAAVAVVMAHVVVQDVVAMPAERSVLLTTAL